AIIFEIVKEWREFDGAFNRVLLNVNFCKRVAADKQAGIGLPALLAPNEGAACRPQALHRRTQSGLEGRFVERWLRWVALISQIEASQALVGAKPDQDQ